MHRDDQEQPLPRCALRPASSPNAHRADRATAVTIRKAASFWPLRASHRPGCRCRDAHCGHLLAPLCLVVPPRLANLVLPPSPNLPYLPALPSPAALPSSAALPNPPVLCSPAALSSHAAWPSPAALPSFAALPTPAIIPFPTALSTPADLPSLPIRSHHFVPTVQLHPAVPWKNKIHIRLCLSLSLFLVALCLHGVPCLCPYLQLMYVPLLPVLPHHAAGVIPASAVYALQPRPPQSSALPPAQPPKYLTLVPLDSLV
ncbi:unnamed protein product [Closterium sp. NIES-54]